MVSQGVSMDYKFRILGTVPLRETMNLMLYVISFSIGGAGAWAINTDKYYYFFRNAKGIDKIKRVAYEY